MPNGYLETLKQIINYQRVGHYNNATKNITYDAVQPGLLFVSSMALPNVTMANQLAKVLAKV